MATTAFHGNPVSPSGALPSVGATAPAFSLTGGDLGAVTSEGLAGGRVVLNIFPSVDTGVCARAVVVIDADGTVLHSQLVGEITDEPDYDAAIAVLG